MGDVHLNTLQGQQKVYTTMDTDAFIGECDAAGVTCSVCMMMVCVMSGVCSTLGREEPANIYTNTISWLRGRRWWACFTLLCAAFRVTDTFTLVSFRDLSRLPPSANTLAGSSCTSASSRRCHLNSQRPSSPWSPYRHHCHIGILPLAAVHEPSAAAADTAPSGASTSPYPMPIIIKSATFHGLRAVSRLLVEEFYGSSLWFPAQCLVELQRLQDNFHSYEEDANRHMMLIATSAEDGSLAGFVDIDGRKKKTGQTGCRPYLSDLAVAHQYRRRGIGTELVKACEEACMSWGYDSMYLKVSDGNVAAERMYENLGYVVHSPKNKKNEVTLCGKLVTRELLSSQSEEGWREA